MAAAVAAVPLLLGSAAWAQTQTADLHFIKAISVPKTPQNTSGGMFSFDISWVDPANGLYFLADRSNAALDVIDTTGAFTGKADSLFGQIGGGVTNFKGDTGSTATSGPDGVVSSTSGGTTCIFAGDGDSRLLSFSSNNFTTLVTALNTGGKFRVDEMAVDPTDGLVLAVNNADDPVFATLVTYNKSTCVLSNPIKITLDTFPTGDKVTNGGEQPAWDPVTKAFYVSIPEINGPGDGTGINGAVAKISTAGVVLDDFHVNYCQPAGLTVGPNGDLLVGCNSVFGTNGKKCSSVVPAPSPTGTTAAHPALCTAEAVPQSAICNPNRGCTGNSLVAVPGAGGGDEVFFNSGDGNYYVTAGNDPVGPVVGVVSSGQPPSNTSNQNKLIQLIPTLSPIPAVATGSAKHGAGTVHSVAASALNTNHHVYIPLPANFAYPNCSTGCIGVFGNE